MKQRNIVVCILLSLVTCGIYGIYWMIVLNDETNALSGRQGTRSSVNPAQPETVFTKV